MTHVVAPDRLLAGWWAVVTSLLVAGCAWLVADSGGQWPFIALFAAAVVVWAWFTVQALAPTLMSWQIDDAGMRGRLLWWRIDIDWAEVFLVRVDRLAGESVLEIITTNGERRTRILPLPVGTSLVRLHEALAATLGHGTQPDGH